MLSMYVCVYIYLPLHDEFLPLPTIQAQVIRNQSHSIAPHYIKSRTHPTHFVVHSKRKHHLWRAIPPRSHILSHESLTRFRRRDGLARARETEIAYFEIAVGVEQEVGRFEVTVDDWDQVRVGRFNVLFWQGVWR